MREILAGIGVAVAVVALVWGVATNGYFMSKVFSPRMEQVRRDTFEQSEAYRAGMLQELENMQFQYEQAAPEQKAALRSIILHRVASVPGDLLTDPMLAFVDRLRKER